MRYIGVTEGKIENLKKTAKTQYRSSLSSFVPNFRILSQVVAEKSLTEVHWRERKITNKGTDKQHVAVFCYTIQLITLTGLSPPVKYFTDRSKAVLLLWIFSVFVLSYVCYVFVRVYIYMCFVVTCWERADLLALVCGVCCEFVTFPLVSWVRCGT